MENQTNFKIKLVTAIAGKIKLKTAIIAGGIIALVVVAFLIFRGGGNVLIPASSDGERWGFINRKGDFVINPQFQDADFFNSGVARVVSNGRIGYVNRRGDFVIPATFKAGTRFDDGLAVVVADGGHPTAIDRRGNTKFVLDFARYASGFSEGLAIFVDESGKQGFVDKRGNIVINAQFDRVAPFSNGFARVWQNNEVGFIDKRGRIVINPQFRQAGNFNEKKAPFSNGQQWGFVNRSGNFAVNPQFNDAGRFSDGLAAVRQGDSYGFINRKGRLTINPQFENTSFFSDGLAAVRQGGRWGFIDKRGNIKINPQFDFAGNFHNGRAIVLSADRWGLIDKRGRFVVNPQFRRIKHIVPDSDDLHFNCCCDRRANRPNILIESDFYDASTFISRFFERAAATTFDGISASSTLAELSEHQRYGAGLNARSEHHSEFTGVIPITNDISIRHIRINFETPIYRRIWTNTGQRDWRGNPIRTSRQEFNFTATPSSIVYHFSLGGRASIRCGAVANAMKTEIESRYGIQMLDEAGVFTGESDNFGFIIAGCREGNLNLTVSFKAMAETATNEQSTAIEEEFFEKP